MAAVAVAIFDAAEVVGGVAVVDVGIAIAAAVRAVGSNARGQLGRRTKQRTALVAARSSLAVASVDTSGIAVLSR